MKPKANLVLVLSLAALVFPAFGQVASSPTVPSVPRAEGAGPSPPSMSSAVGDIVTPEPAHPKASVHPGDSPPTAVELNTAAKVTERSGPGTAVTPVNPPQAAAPAGKIGPTLPANKGWALEGSPTVSATGPASPASEVSDTTMLARQIRELPLTSRADFLTGLETRIEGTERDLNQVRQTSRQLKGDSRAAYLAADEDVKVKHKALKRSLKESRIATPDAWAKSRATLATDYEAYSIALVQVEASSAVGR